jgi:hypothetical protein
MSIDRELLALMTDTVTWSTGSTISQYGVPSFSTASHSMAARIVDRYDEIRDADGQVRAARGTVWCASTSASTYRPSVDDRITLPDGTTPPVLRVETYPDEVDTHHHKVTIGY